MRKFINTAVCSILVILIVRIVRGASPEISFDQLNDQHSVDTVRLAKSKEIRKYMNETADPCENFYEFVCGNWNEINPATSMEDPTTGFMVSLLRTLDRKLRKILIRDEADDTESDKTVKYFYQSCLNISSMMDSYTDKLKDIVKEFGEMPALVGDGWREQDFDWKQTVARIAYKYDIKLIMDIAIGKAVVSENENSIFIDEPNFYLPSKSIYQEEANGQIIREYTNAIAFNLNKYLRLEESEAQRTAKEIVDFEKALVKGTIDKHLVRPFNEVYDQATIEEVHEKFLKYLDIKHQINITLGITPNFQVYTNKAYIQNLFKVLNVTPRKQVANYIFYQLLDNFIFQLPESRQQLEDQCMVNVKTHFLLHLDNIMYRHYSTSGVRKAVLDMWFNIKSTFISTLESPTLNWIKNETRKLALEKIYAMDLEFVSYQQHVTSKEFSTLSISKFNYVGNLQSLLTQKAVNERSKLTDAASSASSYAQFWSPNPYYMLDENVVKIPASILLPYYTWSSTFPRALIFGMLGSMLSHEIIHGFDQTGSTFHAQGNEYEWWDSDSIDAFEDRTKCFIDQYRKYIFGDRYLPEMSDQGENIADNGGIRLAYKSYLKWLEYTNDNIERLEYMPGLENYSNRQLFFISYAHMWCSDTFVDFRNIQTSLDVHVPAEFRVIGPLSNLKEFAEEFNCPIGSGMNPIKKCEIY